MRLLSHDFESCASASSATRAKSTPHCKYQRELYHGVNKKRREHMRSPEVRTVTTSKGDRVELSVSVEDGTPVLTARYPGHYDETSQAYKGMQFTGETAITEYLRGLGFDRNLNPIGSRQ